MFTNRRRPTATLYRNGTAPLTDESLRANAPSIFASQPWEGMSNRYTFIPTNQVVAKLRQEGFMPVAVGQSRTRIPGKGDFTKHVIRFRDFRNGNNGIRPDLGTIFTEIALTNAHDGAAAYDLITSLFRLICTNGMTADLGNVGHIHVRHTGHLTDDVINATYEVVENFPKVIESVDSFSRLRLTAPEEQVFADAALALRYGQDETGKVEAPVTTAQVLRPRRSADVDPNLWNTFNKVQEHLVQGGDAGINSKGQRRKTRAITSVTEDSKLNRALWLLTQGMANLKNGVAAN